MDLLQQYQDEHPEAFAEPKAQSLGEHGFFIRVIMRLSGGRITTERQASMVLVILAAIIFVASLFVFISGGSGSAPSAAPPDAVLPGDGALPF